MLTNDDRRQLEKFTGRHGARMQISLFCTILFLIIVAFVHLYLAYWIAGLHGNTFPEFLGRYAAGILPERNYAGSFIMAANSMHMAVLDFGCALIMAVVYWKKRSRREQTLRVVQALKQSGAW